MKIKVCGITDAAFAQEAARLGAGLLGFVFAKGSPRRVTPARVQAIRAELPAQIRTVGVFTEPDIGEVLATARAAGVDVVQLHGAYSAADAIRAKAAGFETWLLDGGPDDAAAAADALLVDGRAGTRTGGTGRLADWGRVGVLRAGGARVVLAGGLSAENIAAAAATGADILDVNSGVETAPGIKSAELLRAVFRALWASYAKKSFERAIGSTYSPSL